MTLELEAESKAAAERKANKAGMDVNHVQEISDAEHPAEEPRHSRHRGEVPVAGYNFVPAIVTIIIVAGLVWFFWPRIRGFIGL